MQTFESSAQAYDKLSMLTERYNENQSLIQDLRVMKRITSILVVRYQVEGNIDQPIYGTLLTAEASIVVERNRLYAEAKRLSDEMSRLNSLIQNGVFNVEK